MEVTWKDGERIWGQEGLREKAEPHSDAGPQHHCKIETGYLHSYPLPTQQSGSFWKESHWCSPFWKTSERQILLFLGWPACWLPFLFGFLWTLQPHSTTSAPNTPTQSVPFAWGVWPLLSPTCSFLTPGPVQIVDLRLLFCICPLENALISAESPAPSAITGTRKALRRVVLTHQKPPSLRLVAWNV